MQEDKFQEVVVIVGLIFVVIDVGYKLFQFYREGVYSELVCSFFKFDYGVFVVGYGIESGDDYWLVKNRYEVIQFRK